MPGAGICERLLPTNFSIFTLKNVTWWTYLISFTVQYCFLFRFVCIELVALIWIKSSNLSCHLCLWYYSQLVFFNKKIHANLYRHSLWEYSKTFPLFIWMAFDTSYDVFYQNLYYADTLYSIPRFCPLNTGFTVFIFSRGFCSDNDIMLLTLSHFFFF